VRERFRPHATHHRTGGDELGKSAQGAVAGWLAEHRRLTLNPGHIVETAQPCTFLGYRVSRAGLAPGKKLRRRLPERVRRAAGRGPRALERTLQSYRALVSFG
jgi:hypothetical protein